MISKVLRIVSYLSLSVFCSAQSAKLSMPDELWFASDTFFDFGPPFDYYELLHVVPAADGLSIERVLMTPRGIACSQPASVESASIVIHKQFSDLLGGKNPCAIPEKALRREQKRCKKCPTFSGERLTMQVSCGGGDRLLAMNVLESDWFDPAPNTPEHTSWAMSLTAEVDGEFGPRAVDRPIFSARDSQRNVVPDTELVREIRSGKFERLFGQLHEVSNVVKDADQPLPPPPSASIENVEPFQPISAPLPVYPPIAKAARVEGLVTLSFEVNGEGQVEGVTVIEGPKMLEQSAKQAVLNWKFPPLARGKSGHAGIRFSLNCKAGTS